MKAIHPERRSSTEMGLRTSTRLVTPMFSRDRWFLNAGAMGWGSRAIDLDDLFMV